VGHAFVYETSEVLNKIGSPFGVVDMWSGSELIPGVTQNGKMTLAVSC
jgi:hypothetical protein